MFELAWLEFAWPWLAASAILPILAARFLPPSKTIDTPALRIPFFREIDIDGQKSPATKRNWRLLIAVFAWCCLVLAACRPQWVSEPASLPTSGRDLMLAIDLSASMDDTDMSSEANRRTRFQIVKQVAGDFIAKRPGDRIGLILFGSRAHVRVPLTFDRRTVLDLLRESNTGLAGPRTAIGDAIALAIKRLRRQPAASRVLILLSDGESNTGISTEEAIHWAAETAIKIYTIGVGMQIIPQNLAADANEETLQRIADATGGRYFRAQNESELEAIYQLIDRLEPMPFQEAEFRLRKELFYWPLAGAFAAISTLLLNLLFSGRLLSVFRRDETPLKAAKR